jgi:hypothetical protein
MYPYYRVADSVLTQTEKETEHTGKGDVKRREVLSYVATSHRMPRNASNHKKLEETRNEFLVALPLL